MKGVAGSKESNDCLITIESSNETKIEINSIVGAFFYDQIYSTIENTLKNENITDVHVIVEDKGALDYTIKSRLLTAIERMREDV
ncbi:MAG: citrate lyase acyl carrier protein [Candidatus Izemoplasmatales bacterium]|jgi:citrate lyase subunit gamma (acyl carrier protein)|nr:citrate lyase acyl carrier protein [Candidatus Izemoplasmatales bacterium]MDD4069186.1 citrate lyase acyl carrier protein [Candidatus Izemoplasmatales bacterium]MDY0138857.1 citrate lyase acyl carrier protein [Candidatus Izemoplasmatales bacterium]